MSPGQAGREYSGPIRASAREKSCVQVPYRPSIPLTVRKSDCLANADVSAHGTTGDKEDGEGLWEGEFGIRISEFEFRNSGTFPPNPKSEFRNPKSEFPPPFPYAASLPAGVPVSCDQAFLRNGLCVPRVVPDLHCLLVILQGAFPLALQIVKLGKVDVGPDLH